MPVVREGRGGVSKRIRLSIPMNPVPKGRPRVAIRNGKVRTYTPERTQEAQDTLIALIYKHRDKMFLPYVPVRLSITFYRQRSKWSPKSDILPVRKPDLDNLLKLVLDSMSGILIADDAQITNIHMAKRWSKNGHGYISIMLEEDNG